MKTESAVDNIISITDLRRDIDVLKRRLKKNRYTWVFRNQKPFFAVVRPDEFWELRKSRDSVKEMEDEKRKRRHEAVKFFAKVRQEAGNWNATETVIRMRDEEARQWKKER